MSLFRKVKDLRRRATSYVLGIPRRKKNANGTTLLPYIDETLFNSTEIYYPTLISNEIYNTTTSKYDISSINETTLSDLTTQFPSSTTPVISNMTTQFILSTTPVIINITTEIPPTTMVEESNVYNETSFLYSPTMNLTKEEKKFLQNPFTSINTSDGYFNMTEDSIKDVSCYYEGTSIIENGVKRKMTDHEMNLMAEFITASVKFNSEWKFEEGNGWVKVDETVTSNKEDWPDVPCFCTYCNTN
uniref:C-type lectin domain-containing protein n=1 Tax=Parastrongyloides trichosuri TaxID=131310 RepID=A0A0N4ZWE5_PARTI